MARKSNSKLRQIRLIGVELRKGNRAQPIPLPANKGSRGTREFAARAWELKLVD